MAGKLMYIHNDDTQNYPFSRLQLVVDTHLSDETNQNLIKFSKLLGQRIRKGY